MGTNSSGLEKEEIQKVFEDCEDPLSCYVRMLGIKFPWITNVLFQMLLEVEEPDFR